MSTYNHTRENDRRMKQRATRGRVSNVRRWFVCNPPSEEIAKALNDVGAYTCKHKRSPCYLRCGVEQVSGGLNAPWRPITLVERLDWLRATVRA